MKGPGAGPSAASPKCRRGETIETEGQRVVSVRRLSDGLPQSMWLEAPAGVWARFLGVAEGPEAGELCLWPSMHRCFGILDTNSEAQPRSLLSAHLPACQGQGKVAGVRGWRRGVLETTSRLSLRILLSTM